MHGRYRGKEGVRGVVVALTSSELSAIVLLRSISDLRLWLLTSLGPESTSTIHIIG